MTTYRFKLYNAEDSKNLHDIINIAGIIYNHCIDLHKKYYRDNQIFLNKNKLQKHITKWKRRKHKFWTLVNAQAVQNIVERIDEAYKRFFENLKKENQVQLSPPSFQKVKNYKSVTYKQKGYKFLEGNVVIIQGRKYRYYKSREIIGNIKTVTLKRTSLGEFYISVVTDHNIVKKIEKSNRSAVGIDFGLHVFLTLSDGKNINSPLFLINSIDLLSIVSKNFSTKRKGSNNQNKAKLTLIRIHKKIANQRKDWFWKISKDLCELYSILIFEDLDLEKMKKIWGKKISDLGFYEFLTTLESQAKKYGTKIVYLDRYFPSSKLCNSCGLINSNLRLEDREWTCQCGAVHDRDLNASRNILNEGLKQLAE